MSWCDWEVPAWFSGKWPVAKKEHKCCECGSMIRKGEKYGSFSGKWDTDVSTFKQHLECEELCRFIRDFMNYGECIAFGFLNECYDEYDHSKKDIVGQNYRSLVARYKWRLEKGRPLFFKTRSVQNESLENDRKRGWA